MYSFLFFFYSGHLKSPSRVRITIIYRCVLIHPVDMLNLIVVLLVCIYTYQNQQGKYVFYRLPFGCIQLQANVVSLILCCFCEINQFCYFLRESVLTGIRTRALVVASVFFHYKSSALTH